MVDLRREHHGLDLGGDVPRDEVRGAVPPVAVARAVVGRDERPHGLGRHRAGVLVLVAFGGGGSIGLSRDDRRPLLLLDASSVALGRLRFFRLFRGCSRLGLRCRLGLVRCCFCRRLLCSCRCLCRYCLYRRGLSLCYRRGLSLRCHRLGLGRCRRLSLRLRRLGLRCCCRLGRTSIPPAALVRVPCVPFGQRSRGGGCRSGELFSFLLLPLRLNFFLLLP